MYESVSCSLQVVVHIRSLTVVSDFLKFIYSFSFENDGSLNTCSFIKLFCLFLLQPLCHKINAIKPLHILYMLRHWLIPNGHAEMTNRFIDSHKNKKTTL